MGTMPRRLAVATAALGLLVLGGCTGGGEPAPGPSTPGGTQTIGTATPPPPSVEPTGDGIEYEVTYPFAVPGATVDLVNPPPTAGTPHLVGVYVGDHPSESPAYQRISFYFRTGFPSYHFGYVPQIVEDASGEPVPLAGTYYLSVVFDGAQAHDDAGESTVAQTPSRPLGYSGLRDYANAGDFEGYVTYGLGLAGTGRPEIRTGELKRPDGAGGFFYVVHVDVRTS
jgi:hypothetical protein